MGTASCTAHKMAAAKKHSNSHHQPPSDPQKERDKAQKREIPPLGKDLFTRGMASAA
jgi:hypothetical protein